MSTRIGQESTPETHFEQKQLLAVQEIPPELRDSFAVTIRGEKRLIKFTNPLEMPQSWYETGLRLGQELYEYFTIVEEYLRSGGLQKIVGDQTGMARKIIMAMSHPDAFSGFVPCADIAVSEEDGRWSILEINTRPASLGDTILLSQLLGSRRYVTPDNIDVYQALISFLKTAWGGDFETTTALISHPNNAFFHQHSAIASALSIPITSLQNLCPTETGVYLNNHLVRSLIRQCSSAALFDETVCDPLVLDLWKRGIVDIKPGPLNTYTSEKFFLNLFPRQNYWLLQNQNMEKQEEFSAKEYQGYWLKGRADESEEITIFLSEPMLTGSRRKFIDALVRRDYHNAAQALTNIANSNDGKRFAGYLNACTSAYSTQWVLQKNIETIKVKIVGQPKDLKTVLRVHFIPTPEKERPFLPFMHLYADDQIRVSARGYTIPLCLG